jgi:hypothetical protein
LVCKRKANIGEGKNVGEYNTIPLLIETLNIEGSTVTIDVVVCYTEIANAICRRRWRLH